MTGGRRLAQPVALDGRDFVVGFNGHLASPKSLCRIRLFSGSC